MVGGFIMTDFWIETGDAYLTFSQYCHYKDWQAILQSIANEIVAVTKRVAVPAVLDVGCGIGINTLNIAEIIYSETRKRVECDVVEPSTWALDIATHVMQKSSDGGFLRKSFTAVHLADDRQYDAILFMHSAYYIKDFGKTLMRLYRHQLREGGAIILLALSDSSPFFLNDSRLILPNTSTAICGTLQKEKLPFAAYPLRSRLVLSDTRLSVAAFVTRLNSFVSRGKLTDSEFRRAMTKITNDGYVDFSDELLVVRRG